MYPQILLVAHKQRHRTARKKLRSFDKAPIRILDHIRDFFYYPTSDNVELSESELNLLTLYRRLSYWNDQSVYKNEKGEIYPEVLNAMLCIKGYEEGAQSEAIKKASKK